MYELRTYNDHCGLRAWPQQQMQMHQPQQKHGFGCCSRSANCATALARQRVNPGCKAGRKGPANLRGLGSFVQPQQQQSMCQKGSRHSKHHTQLFAHKLQSDRRDTTAYGASLPNNRIYIYKCGAEYLQNVYGRRVRCMHVDCESNRHLVNLSDRMITAPRCVHNMGRH
jgi:hypothetical protein